jgi:hypothetical protein
MLNTDGCKILKQGGSQTGKVKTQKLDVLSFETLDHKQEKE